MKKTTLVAVLALTLLFALAATALADVALPKLPANSFGGNFETWDATVPANSNLTPHVGYSTTSEKCSVCHSVHNAGIGTSASGDGNILLRANVADSCTFCHVAVSSVSSKRPYGTNAAAYTVDDQYNHASTQGSWVGTYGGCGGCHSVHGANTFTEGGLTTSILRNTGVEADVPVTFYDAGSPRAEVLTAFCSRCHTYYDAAYDTTTNDAPSHIMKASGANYGNTEAATAAQATIVAYAPSTTCISCHDASGTGASNNNFPHDITGSARFLNVAANSTAATAAIGAEASVDGACIKCHLNGASAGVGTMF